MANLTYPEVVRIAVESGFPNDQPAYWLQPDGTLTPRPDSGDAYKTRPPKAVSVRPATIMGAIAMRESSGDPTAHNPVPPDDSYGLWQINMIGNLGPTRRAALGIATNDELFDPHVNGRAALMIFNDAANASKAKPYSVTWTLAGLKPWTTRTAALRTLWEVIDKQESGEVDEGWWPTDIIPRNIRNPLASIYDAIVGLVGILTDPDWWRRIGVAALGGLVIVAAIMLWSSGGL